MSTGQEDSTIHNKEYQFPSPSGARARRHITRKRRALLYQRMPWLRTRRRMPMTLVK